MTFNESFKNIYSCYGFLESRQEPIKRTSLNTQILIVIFNEILIPQDSFSRTIITRQRIRRRKFATTFPKWFYLKFHNLFLYISFYILENMKAITTSHDMPE